LGNIWLDSNQSSESFVSKICRFFHLINNTESASESLIHYG
jgi:hypothetical protein